MGSSAVPSRHSQAWAVAQQGPVHAHIPCYQPQQTLARISQVGRALEPSTAAGGADSPFRQDEAFLRKLQRIEARHIASYQPAPDIAKTTKKATSHAGKSPKGKKAAKAAGIASRTGTSPLAQGCLIASDPDTKTKSSKGLKASKDVTKRPLRRHPASTRVDPEAALKENWTIKDRTTPQKRSPRASNTTAVKLSDLARLVKAKTNEVKVKPAPAQQAGQPKVTTFQLQGNYPGQKRIPLVVVTPADANSSHKPATSEKRRRAFAVLPANSDKQVDSDSEEFSSYDPMRSWYGAVNRNMPPTPLKRKAAVLIEDIPVPQLTFDSSLSDIADDETDDESGNDTCESARDGATRPLPALFDDEHDDTRMDDPHVSSSDGDEDDTEECEITNRKISSGRKRRIQESDSDTSDDDDDTCEDSAIEDAKDDNDVDELSTDTKDDTNLIPVPADLLPHIGEIKQAYHGDIEIEDFGEYSPYAQLYWGAPVETNDKTNDIDEQVFARELLASLKVLDPACSQAPTTEMATAPTESAEVPQVTTHKAPLANIRAKGSTRASAKRRFTAGVLDDRTDKVNKQPLSISSFLSGMLLGADEDDTSDRFESESVKVPAKRRHQVPGSARSAIPLGLDLPRSPPRKRARVNFQQDAADTFGFMPVMPLAASQTA